jgi:nucleotide-binding universal stress UspA family protein
MFTTVLWATDGSAAAAGALSAAKSIAQAYDAKLVVMHVPVVLAGSAVAVGVAQQSAEATRAALQRTVEELKRDGVTTEFALPEIAMHGPAHVIAEFAREVDAELVVAWTRGSSRLVRVLVGSVTRRLLELAPCPVLAVPPQDDDIAP